MKKKTVRNATVHNRASLLKGISPERTFPVIGLLCGLVFVFATPPFQVPDEPQHFFRAFQVSELRILNAVYLNRPEGATMGWSYGALLPRSLSILLANSDLTRTRFRPASKLDSAKIFASKNIPLRPTEREYLPIAPYPPPAYGPQAIAIALGRLLGQGPLVLLYLGRIGALASWICLVFLAIKRTPVLKWTFFLLALMPMTLYLAASNSSDSIVIGLSFLFTATLLNWAYDDTKVSIKRKDVLFLALLAIGITLSKAIYLVLSFLFVVIPTNKFKSKKEYWATLAGVIAVAVGAYYVWGFLVEHTTNAGPSIQFAQFGVDPTPFPNISPPQQVEFMYSNPVAFLRVLVNTGIVLGGFLLNSFFGLLGWLDTWMPAWLPILYGLALVGSSLLISSEQRITALARFVSIFIFGATFAVSLLSTYAMSNPVGAGLIQGYQGRYLIPVAPAFFLLFQRRRVTERMTAVISPILLMVFVTATTATAAYRVIDRFYWGEVAPVAFHVDELSVSPEGNMLIVNGWAVDNKAREVANAVVIAIDGRDFPARYGIERRDVAESMSTPSYQYSGFEARIPAAELGAGTEHTLAIKIETRDQKMFMVSESKLTIAPR